MTRPTNTRALTPLERAERHAAHYAMGWNKMRELYGESERQDA